MIETKASKQDVKKRWRATAPFRRAWAHRPSQTDSTKLCRRQPAVVHEGAETDAPTLDDKILFRACGVFAKHVALAIWGIGSNVPTA